MEQMLTYNGKEVCIFCLRNSKGTEVEITNFGARIVSLRVADGKGKLVGRADATALDVVQGFDRVVDYFPENNATYYGAFIGRYANRLAGGRITLEGVEYRLPQNNGPNCLHGGTRGWQDRVLEVVSSSERSLSLRMTSPDGDNGFPGRVEVGVVYTLDDDNALRIDYRASTDRPTVINMTNHSYFNLNGDGSSSILNHELMIDADRYTPIDETSIPLGDHLPVEGTPMDFREAKPIGRDIESDFEQLRIGHGYDHNYVLNTRGSLERPCAVLSSPVTGIALEVYTTAPGMQLYTGNFINGEKGKGGVAYPRRSAVCLETQQYPDSPNHHWPESTGRLFPDQPFESTTIFKFKQL